MNRFVTWLSAAAALALAASPLAAQTDTTFTYQGRLLDTGAPANGAFNLGFSLWDALSAGNQVGSTILINGVQVIDGSFNAELDFGAAAFDNSNRWLEIVVNGSTLSPRQPISRSPYSIQTRGIFVDENNNVGIGTSTPTSPLHVESGGDKAIFAHNTAASFTTYGVFGTSDSTSGRGVFGEATSSIGATYGGEFVSRSPSGTGVFGLARGFSGTTYGGRFESNSPDGRGALGIATAPSGTTYGGWFESDSTSGRGVLGLAIAGSGTTYGGFFENWSSTGRGVFSRAIATTGINYGGWFETRSTTGRALFGLASANSGVNFGVVGHSNSSRGFDFWASGAGTNYGAPSSRRWKSNVVPIGDPLDKLARLQGVYFDWDGEHGGQHDLGMIAEEVGEVLPEIVQYEENGIDAIGMDYSKMTPLLVEAVNALRTEKNDQLASLRTEKDKEIEELRVEKDDEVNELRAANAALESRLTQIEAALAQIATNQGNQQ